MIFQTCRSFINLFPDHFFFEKIKFLYKWSCRQEPPIFVRNVVFACSSASGMHHYFTVQLYTTWRHPGLIFVYETSLTIRWLKKRRRRWIAMCWPRPVVPTRAVVKIEIGEHTELLNEKEAYHERKQYGACKPLFTFEKCIMKFRTVQDAFIHEGSQHSHLAAELNTQLKLDMYKSRKDQTSAIVHGLQM